MNSDSRNLEKAWKLGLVDQEEMELWKGHFAAEEEARHELAVLEESEAWLLKSAESARKVLEDLKSGRASKLFIFVSKKDHAVMTKFREDLIRTQELVEDCEGALELVREKIKFRHQGTIHRANAARDRISARLEQALTRGGRSAPSGEIG